jgi:hypothetical protein
MRIITEVISRDELAEHIRVAPGCTTEAGQSAGAAAIEPIAARSL